MKKRLLNFAMAFGLILFFSTPMFAQTDAAPAGGAQITFEEETHDFDELVQGGDASYVFKFTNTGTEDLIISTAKGSCGCTVPKWSSEPVAPGAEGEIAVRYDSNRIGVISKSVTINSNAANAPIKTIYIKGNISPKPAAPSFLAPTEGTPANN